MSAFWLQMKLFSFHLRTVPLFLSFVYPKQTDHNAVVSPDRVFYEILLLHQRKEAERLQNLEKRRTLTSRLKTLRQICTPSKSKCVSKNQQVSRHLTIEIDEFNPEIFRLIVLFLHCGKVDITVSTLVGRLIFHESVMQSNTWVICLFRECIFVLFSVSVKHLC